MNRNWRHDGGPWTNEPDELDFEHAGIACYLKRHPSMGHWCGYVAVPASHPLYGLDYDADAPCLPASEYGSHSVASFVDVHGGVTYAGPKPGGDGGGWWFGFDCAHCGDCSPGSGVALLSDGVYRRMDYVREQTEAMAERIAEVRPVEPSRN